MIRHNIIPQVLNSNNPHTKSIYPLHHESTPTLVVVYRHLTRVYSRVSNKRDAVSHVHML